MKTGAVRCHICDGSGRKVIAVGSLPRMEVDCALCGGYGNVRLERVATARDLHLVEYDDLMRHQRAAHLAAAVTGDHAHLADPIVWLAEHAQREVYRVVRPEPTDVHALNCCELGDDARLSEDARTLSIYVTTMKHRVWWPFLEERGWEVVSDDAVGVAIWDPFADFGGRLRAPSGAVYAHTMFMETPALDVALARECADVRRTLVEAHRVIVRTRTSLGGRTRKTRGDDQTGSLFGDKHE